MVVMDSVCLDSQCLDSECLNSVGWDSVWSPYRYSWIARNVMLYIVAIGPPEEPLSERVVVSTLYISVSIPSLPTLRHLNGRWEEKWDLYWNENWNGEHVPVESVRRWKYGKEYWNEMTLVALENLHEDRGNPRALDHWMGEEGMEWVYRD